MADPKRIKKAHVTVSVNYKDTGNINLYLVAPREVLEPLNQKEREETIKDGISKIQVTPAGSMNSIRTFFSYMDDGFLRDFDFGNILVEAHMPYCLHVPNEHDIEVVLPTGEKVLITLRKIWTNKARTDTEVSDEVDFFADNRTTYFHRSTILTPKMPINPDEGWQQNFTGTNLQKIKDTNGIFRFSHLYIQLNFSVKKEDLKDKEKIEKILCGIHEQALSAVNLLIDNYRFVTKEEHVTRLGDLSINMIYIIDQKHGIYLSPMRIETAIVNRSKKEIDLITQLLKDGEKPSLYELLLLDAQNSFNNKNYTLAIVQSFQALEIFIENFLIKEFINQGKTEQESIDYLTEGSNWKTKTRLKELLKEVKGFSVYELDQTLWIKWCALYDVRNEVIHKGKEINLSETKGMLESNIKIIELIKKI